MATGGNPDARSIFFDFNFAEPSLRQEFGQVADPLVSVPPVRGALRLCGFLGGCHLAPLVILLRHSAIYSVNAAASAFSAIL